MAAQQAQLQNIIATTSSEPLPVSDAGRLFGDVPTRKGKLHINTLFEGLKRTIRHQMNLYDTAVSQTNPGAANHPGGAGNAAVQATHFNMEVAAKHYIMSMVVLDSALYRLMGTAPFALGSTCVTYLNAMMQLADSVSLIRFTMTMTVGMNEVLRPTLSIPRVISLFAHSSFAPLPHFSLFGAWVSSGGESLSPPSLLLCILE